ncbi:MAG: hypothetical protein V8R80_10870 [Eubacterium sp.]
MAIRYYTVTKTTPDGKDAYAADSLIHEVNRPVYTEMGGTLINDIPSFTIDTPVKNAGNDAYSLRCVVTGTTKTPASGSSGTDTRLKTATGYTFYWYKDGKYYTYDGSDTVGSLVDPAPTSANGFFDVYYKNEQETTNSTESGTEGGTGSGTESGTEGGTGSSTEKTKTETVILGREETWMTASGESGSSDAYETETGYLYTRLIKTKVGEADLSIGVTVMEMSEESSYKDSSEQAVTDPAAWSIVTTQETR